MNIKEKENTCSKASVVCQHGHGGKGKKGKDRPTGRQGQNVCYHCELKKAGRA